MNKILLILTPLIVACLGCGQSATRVSIPIKMQSEINVNKYANFAVFPFLEEQLQDGHEETPSEMPEEIASIMRRGLGRYKNLSVVGTQETSRMLTGETIDANFLTDIDRLVRLGRYLESDVLVLGSYKFYTMSEPRRYYGERYSRSQQRYVMDYQDYLQKNYILSLRVLIIDVDAEKIVWDDEYDRSAVEAHTLGSFLVSQAMPHEIVLKNLAKQAVAEFTRKIAPHYETEDRFLVN